VDAAACKHAPQAADAALRMGNLEAASLFRPMGCVFIICCFYLGRCRDIGISGHFVLAHSQFNSPDAWMLCSIILMKANYKELQLSNLIEGRSGRRNPTISKEDHEDRKRTAGDSEKQFEKREKSILRPQIYFQESL
jgi:hypothetical protein